MTKRNERYEEHLPKLLGTTDDDFNLWSTRVNAVLRTREPAAGLSEDNISSVTDERALAFIISALRNNIFRTLQDCTTTRAVWSKPQPVYLDKTMTNKLEVLQTLLNFRMRREN